MSHSNVSNGKHAQTQSLDALVSGQSNFLLLLIEATQKDQSTLDQQQLNDAQTTENSIKMEQAIYETWNGPNGKLSQDASRIPQSGDGVAAAQAVYSSDSATAQASESQQDGVVQASQGATSGDSQNLSTKAQLAQGVQGILTMVSNLLSQGA